MLYPSMLCSLNHITLRKSQIHLFHETTQWCPRTCSALSTVLLQSKRLARFGRRSSAAGVKSRIPGASIFARYYATYSKCTYSSYASKTPQHDIYGNPGPLQKLPLSQGPFWGAARTWNQKSLSQATVSGTVFGILGVLATTSLPNIISPSSEYRYSQTRYLKYRYLAAILVVT